MSSRIHDWFFDKDRKLTSRGKLTTLGIFGSLTFAVAAALYPFQEPTPPTRTDLPSIVEKTLEETPHENSPPSLETDPFSSSADAPIMPSSLPSFSPIAPTRTTKTFPEEFHSLPHIDYKDHLERLRDFRTSSTERLTFEDQSPAASSGYRIALSYLVTDEGLILEDTYIYTDFPYGTFNFISDYVPFIKFNNVASVETAFYTGDVSSLPIFSTTNNSLNLEGGQSAVIDTTSFLTDSHSTGVIIYNAGRNTSTLFAFSGTDNDTSVEDALFDTARLSSVVYHVVPSRDRDTTRFSTARVRSLLHGAVPYKNEQVFPVAKLSKKTIVYTDGLFFEAKKN